jgi:hypothetical protein
MVKKLPKSINLIDTINPPGETFTIFYEWSFTVGKYLLIFAQVVVIAVFIMRLYVDRINNDLTMDINKQVEFLMQGDLRANEAKYRNIQKLFNDLALLDANHEKNSRKIVSVLDSVPNSVTLLDFSFATNRVGANFIASSLEDIRRYEAFLKQNPEYSNVSLNLEKKGAEDQEIEFSVTYLIVKRDQVYE